jgi:hypothetical protein
MDTNEERHGTLFLFVFIRAIRGQLFFSGFGLRVSVSGLSDCRENRPVFGFFSPGD